MAAKLNSQVVTIIDKMKAANKVTSLTYEETTVIEQNLAEGLKSIKKKFEIRERNSRAYVRSIELKSNLM